MSLANMLFSRYVSFFNRWFTFLILTDLRGTRPLGPVILVLLLLPEGKALVVGGLDGVLTAAFFFSVRFFWDETLLLFPLKVDELLSWVSLVLVSGYCPFLIRSRYSLSNDCVAGSLNQLKKSSSTFILRTGWRTCDGILLIICFFLPEHTCLCKNISNVNVKIYNTSPTFKAQPQWDDNTTWRKRRAFVMIYIRWKYHLYQRGVSRTPNTHCRYWILARTVNKCSAHSQK